MSQYFGKCYVCGKYVPFCVCKRLDGVAQLTKSILEDHRNQQMAQFAELEQALKQTDYVTNWNR